MTECGICLEPIDSEYAIINCDGESGKYHVEHLAEWFSTHKTGILTQSPIETYNIFENDEHTKTINIESHYDNIKIFMSDINFLWNGNSEEYADEDDDVDVDECIPIFCCFW